MVLSMAKTLSQRGQQLVELLETRILVLDGATGTYLQDLNLTAKDFGGEELEGCNENLCLTRPAIIQAMHKNYLLAGADIVETNTFGATPLVLDEYGLGKRAHQINKQAAQLARAACEEVSSPDKPRFVAGSLGPTTKAITVTGGVTFETLEENFYIQALGLIEGGVDYLLLETVQDTRNVKAAMNGVAKAQAEMQSHLPIAISCTIEPMGTMLAGQGVESFYTSVMHHDLLYVGMNCATGPAFMTDHIRSLAAIAKTRTAVIPNAGLPDEDGIYLESPSMMENVLRRFVDAGWVNVIGGCCGTTPEYTRRFSDLAQNGNPRTIPTYQRSMLSGVDFLEVEDENRPILVGERTNAVGSRKFKRLISEEKYEESSEIARRQVLGGAQVIDVNLANPDRDEVQDMQQFLTHLIQKVRVPLMIDSTDAAVIKEALPYSQGKAIINSVNLENGEERFEEVVPLALKYGAALVVGTIDEDLQQSMAITRQRKLEVAKRSHQLLTQKYGVEEEDLYFDPLVFPCATGDKNYLGSAAETIEGVGLIKHHLPRCKTVLGISNVSFGLPLAGREVLNAVFLNHCVEAGLDLAIVNTEMLRRYSSLAKEEIELADNLLFNRGEDAIALFAAHYRGKSVSEQATPLATMSLDERLGYYILAGSKDGLVDDLKVALKERAPLEVINGPLMAGMAEVGRLFNDNKMIVAEVLQSAEAMKAAVGFLETFMERNESASKGKMLLATVKGDVHDIGKNLVEIIFSNNGYQVVNLGIKCPPEQLISAWNEHQTDLIGLSGLLVKSAQQMVITAEDLHSAGVNVPILVGGAALSRNFALRRIGPAYGKDGMVVYASDAMSGLDLANRLMAPEKRQALREELAQEAIRLGAKESAIKVRMSKPITTVRSNKVRIDIPIPTVPDTKQHTLQQLHLDEIWQYLNPEMLYGKHLGLRGSAKRLLAQGDEKALQLQKVVHEVQSICRRGKMAPRATWQFFPSSSEGNTLNLLDEAGEKTLQTFRFPRQQKEAGLCLADFVLPRQLNQPDHVAMFVTTAGEGVRELAEKWKNEGAYLRSHVLQALALETAEAAAEWMHTKIREMWGCADDAKMTMRQRFAGRYRGARYSFGYPACPELENQEGLFRMLTPTQIGVELTDGFMMEPEASVSALVFHHPDAKYFSVGPGRLADI